MELTLLAHQPVLVGALVRLEPMGERHVDALWPLYAEGDEPAAVAALRREQVCRALASAAARADRADWAVVALDHAGQGERVVGEVVLFELDEVHAAMTFRIALVGPEVFGRGYGGEATRLVRDFAFDRLGLHRLQLDVRSHNVPARRAYARAGFVVEGCRRQVELVGGEWVDAIDMALLDTDPRP